jgi:hypothetical protein
MKLAIVIPTYYKKNGSTAVHLEKTLMSVKNQFHNDYCVYLIGDDYDDYKEFKKLSSIISADKIKAVNLTVALERTKYKGEQLWFCGGTNANNFGVQMALADNLNYVCHLDHDDIWLPNHLEEINKVLESVNTNFICTRANYATYNVIIPPVMTNDYYIKYLPEANQIIHSSTCINFKYFNFKYRNMIEECNKNYPGDADMWNRISEFYKKNNEFGILINQCTVLQEQERSCMKKI